MPATLATPASIEEAAFSVDGMDCASCVSHVEKAALAVPGVTDCQVNLARGRAVVHYSADQTQLDAVASAITASGYPAQLEVIEDALTAEHHRLSRQKGLARSWLRRAVIGLLLWLPFEATHWILSFFSPHDHAMHQATWMDWVGFVTSALAIVLVGSGFYRGAWMAARRRTTDMDTLIALGASVAFLYSAVALLGFIGGAWQTKPDLYFMEGTGLLALISLGHWLEARARDSAGSAIRQLLDLAPATALLMPQTPAQPAAGRRALPVLESPSAESAAPREVAVASLNVGDRVLVRPGDRIPIDGVVDEGRSGVDESMITGESLPATRDVGDSVIGGTLNQDGRLIVRVSRVGSQTALAQIVQLVEKAQSSKPPVQKLADQIAAVFVPVVLGIAVLTAAGWYAWGTLHGWPPAATWGMAAKAVCSVLIIACPCALGLAIPAALMVGTGRGARRGILIRDIDALQQAERISTIVLDKTGTVTRGKPNVVEVIPADGVTESDLLFWAATAEQFSAHPLASAIVAFAAGKGIRPRVVKGFQSEPGLGVIAQIEGRELLAGAEVLVTRHGGIVPPADDKPGTRVYLAWHDPSGVVSYAGLILLADEVKPDSAAALADLRAMGLRTVLLTGDNALAAAAVAKQVGIDDVRADVRPAGKADVIRLLQTGGVKAAQVAMVGDGVNDAPALAQSDLGIAIGSGSDVAKEAGDIVLVSGSLAGVAAAIRLSRATMRTIRQNLFLAFIYNVVAIPLAAFGLLNPLIAAACMALSDVSVIGNALLLRQARIDPRDAPEVA